MAGGAVLVDDDGVGHVLHGDALELHLAGVAAPVLEEEEEEPLNNARI